jgi:hypothetical protein
MAFDGSAAPAENCGSRTDPHEQLRLIRRRFRYTLLRRFLISCLLALVVTPLLAILPHGQRVSGRLYERDRGQLVRVSNRYGWPWRVAMKHEFVWRGGDGTFTPWQWSDAPPNTDPALIARLHGVTGWRVDKPALAGLFLLCFGLAFAIGAARPTKEYHRASRNLERDVCPQCGYPKIGLPEPRCPECGRPF